MTEKQFTKIRNRILKIIDDIQALQSEKQKLSKELKEWCTHASVIETPRLPSASGLFVPIPASRICIFCGYEEEKYNGIGSLQKSSVLKIVDRNTFYSYRKLQPLTTRVVPEGI